MLRSDNQTPTRVTPRIARLAEGYTQGQLHVVGPKLDKPTPSTIIQQEEMQKRLFHLLSKTSVSHRPKIQLRKRHKRTVYFSEFITDEEVIHVSTYLSLHNALSNRSLYLLKQVGEYVLVLAGQDGNNDPPELPLDLRGISHDQSPADFFW